MWQGSGTRVGQTEMAKCNEPEPEDAEITKLRGGRGRGGRGQGRGRACAKLHRLRSKTRVPSNEEDKDGDQWWTRMTEDEMKEWYIFRGWTPEEVEEWWGWGDSREVCNKADQKTGKRKKAKGVITPKKPKAKVQKNGAAVEAEDGHDDQPDEVEVPVKEVSFARRPVPTRPSAYTRWSGIKLAFHDKISFYVETPSKYQADS